MPDGYDRTAWGNLLSVALGSAILFCHLGTTLGPIASAASVGFAVILLILSHRDAPAQILRFATVSSYGAVALLSAAWSVAPDMTLYYGVQLLITIGCAFAIWLALDLRQFLRAVLIAAVCICLVSIAVGTTGPSKTGPVLIGVTGSKNSMAAAGHLALLVGMVTVVDPRMGRTFRVLALPAMVVGGFIVATTHAATDIILAVLAAPLLVSFWFLHRLPKPWRAGLLIGVAILLAPLAIMHKPISRAATDYLFTTFDKDPTLTGRAYLWELGDGLVAQKPLTGWGYKAILMGNTQEGIGMLRSQQVQDPRAFSFHNTYLEARVDTGFIGWFCLVVTIAVGTLAACLRAIYRGGTGNAFIAVFLISMVARSFSDNLIAPFFAYFTLLLIAVAYALYGNANQIAKVPGSITRHATLSRHPA